MNDQIPDFDVQWRGGPLSAVRIKLVDGSQLTLGEAVRDALKLRTIEAPSATGDKLIDGSQLAPKSLDATLSRQLDTIRDQLARIEELEQLNVIAHDKQRELETDIVHLHEQLDLIESDAADAREESSDVIRKCNEQLAALAAAAKLRDQQVETLARLWSAAFELTGSPVGAVITRQLYRVMADHGVDVNELPDPPTIDIADCA